MPPHKKEYKNPILIRVVSPLLALKNSTRPQEKREKEGKNGKRRRECGKGTIGSHQT